MRAEAHVDVALQNPGGDVNISRGANQLPAEPTGESNEKNPAGAYAVAILFTIAILVIVCMPSRKG